MRHHGKQSLVCKTEIAAALATYDAHFPHAVGGDQMA